MEVLQRSMLDNVIADILFQIYRDNHFEYPDAFDRLAKEITSRMMEKFDCIEANPKVYKAIDGLSPLPMEIRKYYKIKKLTK